jgi:hypothetical protein
VLLLAPTETMRVLLLAPTNPSK